MRQAENGYLIQFWGAIVFLLGFGAWRYGLVGLVIGIGLMTTGSWLWPIGEVEGRPYWSNHRRYPHVMRPLRYSINVTLDGCCDHRAFSPEKDLHRHAAENLAQADALLFGRVTYEMMEAGWRPPAPTGTRPDWMEPFARTINVAKKNVVEHAGPGRLERGARARGSGEGRSAAQAGVG